MAQIRSDIMTILRQACRLRTLDRARTYWACECAVSMHGGPWQVDAYVRTYAYLHTQCVFYVRRATARREQGGSGHRSAHASRTAPGGPLRLHQPLRRSHSEMVRVRACLCVPTSANRFLV